MTQLISKMQDAQDAARIAIHASDAAHLALSAVGFRNAARAFRDAAAACDEVHGEASSLLALASTLEHGRILGDALAQLKVLKASGLLFADCVRAFSPSDDAVYQLKALKDAGLLFSDCVEVFGSSDDPFLLIAKEDHQEDGALEFDDVAVVSHSDSGGAYVMGWRWVDAPEQGDAQ